MTPFVNKMALALSVVIASGTLYAKHANLSTSARDSLVMGPFPKPDRSVG